MSDRYLNFDEPIESSSGGSLPHWEQEGKLQFVTFRLGDSLPQTKLRELSQIKTDWLMAHPQPWNKGSLVKYNNFIEGYIQRWLDADYGECVLRRPGIAKIVADTIEEYNYEDYIINDYVVMPNHVHAVIQLLEDVKLSNVLRIWKGKSARLINMALNRDGAVWFKESFDRLVRNPRHLEAINNYIDKNEKQGGLIRKRYE